MIAGILDQRIPQHPRYVQGIELLQLGVVAALVTWLMMQAPLLTACLAVLLIELVLATVNLELWQRAGFAIPIASSMLLGAVLFVAQLLYGYFVETRKQQKMAASLRAVRAARAGGEDGARPRTGGRRELEREAHGPVRGRALHPSGGTTGAARAELAS